MSTVFSQIGNVVSTAITNMSNTLTDTINTQGAELTAKLGTKPTYFEQSTEPTTAVSGDLWRDTDNGIIACLYIENSNKVWMEI